MEENNLINNELNRRGYKDKDEFAEDPEIMALRKNREIKEKEVRRTKTIKDEKQRIRSASLEKYKPALKFGKGILTGIKQATNKVIKQKSGSKKKWGKFI